MTTLAQTRNMTLADCMTAMEKLSQVAVRLAITKAQREKRLLAVEQEFNERMEADQNEAELTTMRIKEFCRSNPHHFVKPRKIKTAFGEFGLQIVTDLKIDSEDAMVQTLFDRGYEDCLKRSVKPDKDAIRERIEAGEVIPGATIRTEPNDPVVKINRDILKSAVEKAA